MSSGKDLNLVIKGALFTLLIQVAAVVLSFGNQVLLARWMGPFEFGIYAFAWSLVPSLAVIAAIGLPGAAIRFVPQYLNKQESAPLHGLIRRGVAIALVVGTVAAGMGWLLIMLADPWLDEYYVRPAQLALMCVPLLALIALLAGMSRGFEWAGLAAIPPLLLMPGLLIAGVTTYWALGHTPTAVTVLQIALAACAVAALLHLVFFRRAVSKAVQQTMPVYETRHWLKVAIPLFLSDGVLLLLWSCDEVMLGSMTSPEHVSIYHASVKTAGLTLVFFNAITAMAAPRFSSLWGENDKTKCEQFARGVSRLMFFPSAAVVLVLVLLGPLLLASFGEFFVSGYPVLIILACGYLVRSATGPNDAYLAVTGNQNAIVLVTGSAAVLNIVLNLLLIPEYGVKGAAVASIIAVCLASVWQYVLVRRRLKINTFFLARK